jgi:bifunctional UDP-N-acetylglucosamine pyrophosphorylase/glucosamine-1-phosphate N-acetyltransferase
MKAVIPCAKKKDDMFPFSETLPTALMPLMGRPIAEQLVNDLLSVGVDEVYIVGNHLLPELEDHFEEFDSVEIVEQEEINGTGGAIDAVDIEEEFFVVNGDVAVSRSDLKSLKDAHDGKVSDVTMLATDESRPEKFGVLSITNDRVEDIVEKPEDPENNLINTGIYVFTPEIFSVLEDMEGQKDLTDAVSKLVEQNGARFELVGDYWLDIGSPQKLRKADAVKREYHIRDTEVADSADVADSAVIDGDARIADGAEVRPNTVVEGRVYIGEDAVVGPNTVVRDSTIGDGSLVENATVRGSLLFQGNVLDPYVSVERCVMGEETDVKPGTVIRESFIGGRSFIDMNNSIRGLKFVPDARTDLSEISK